MTDKEKVQAILNKYHRDYATFSENVTRKEFRTILKYVPDGANRKQRKIAGLDK